MKLTLRIAILAALALVLGALFFFNTQEETERYSGETRNGLPHGFGIWEHASGVYYAGHFREGERHGRGTWIHPDGIKYAGLWEHGQYHGRGTLILPGGARYIGEWEHGQKHGPGIHRQPDGTTYTGWWVDDRREGFGIMEKPGGYIYRGQWLNGLRHGDGTAVYPDGSEYHGQWLNDNRHGQGTMVYPDGSVYEGGWARDKKHGEGTLTCPEGTVKTATWNEGRLREVPIESISLDPASLSLVAGGESATLEVEISPEDATEQELEWESSNPDIAAVEDGEVRPLSTGSATITATSACGNHTAVCTVTIRTTAVGVSGVSLDRRSITMQVGETAHLGASIRPAGATNTAVSWSSSDASVAAVYQETGHRAQVRAFEPGELWVTVRTADGGHTDRCQVTVIPKEDPANKVIVPRLIGQPVEEARNMINEAGLYLGNVSFEYHRSAPEDQVISQTPAIGATVNRGSAVHLVLSRGPFPEETEEEEPEETEDEEEPDPEEPDQEEPGD